MKLTILKVEDTEIRVVTFHPDELEDDLQADVDLDSAEPETAAIS